MKNFHTDDIFILRSTGKNFAIRATWRTRFTQSCIL